MSCLSHRSALFALLLVWVASTIHAAENTTVLIVDLYLNGQQMGETFVLQGDDGNFFVEQAVLREWQVSEPWPQPIHYRGKQYYGLHRFVGASADLNSRAMLLQVQIPPSLMPTRTVNMRAQGSSARSEAFGLYMDYHLNWLSYGNSGQRSTNALLQPVLFGKYGNLRANSIYRHHSGASSPFDDQSQSGLTLLELTYTLDDPENLRSLRVGDVFSHPGSMGQALRIGGIQLATNFETQPSFITYPLPRFFGEASIPTALDVYVNGRLRRTENVEPGSYVLEDMPVVNGSGEIQVVARDALGRQQVFTQDFYASTELLRPGLSDYSISIGALREGYGLESFDYGDFAASGTWRYGIRENLTVEGHGAFAGHVGMISGSSRYAISSGGTLTTGLGLSSGDRGNGGSWKIGFRQQTDLLNFSVDLTGTTRRFERIGTTEPAPELQFFGSAGKNFYEYGFANLSVVHQSFYERPTRTIISANHSFTVKNSLKLSAHASYVDADSNDFSVGLRFSMPFGERHYSNGGYTGSRTRKTLEAEVNRALPLGNGYGYRLGIGTLDNRYVDAGLAVQSEFGNYSIDVRDSSESGSVWQAGARGSIAYLSGMTNFTRQIRDAFAVVNVGEIEGVRVYAENVEIGRTDKNGQLFIPGLRPYMSNQLRIELDDLPLSARIGHTRTTATPYYRSGVVVNFDVRLATNVMFRAVSPDGRPLPEGAVAKVFPSNDSFPVGRDGKLYLQGIDRSSEIEIRWTDKVCDIDVPYPTGGGIITKMGDIVCVPRIEH